MSNNRKEEIVLVTLELAAQKGLANVSMNMIADKIGIKKPSLYKHFASKDEIVESMYAFLRKQVKEKENIKPIDYSTLFEGKTAFEVLCVVVYGYIQMNHQEQMLNFYRVIYSERSLEPMAAKIVAEETKNMINATRQLFYALEVHKLLHFENPDMSALSFAMTIHGLMDYELDQSNGECSDESDKNLLEDYLKWFCEENAIWGWKRIYWIIVVY